VELIGADLAILRRLVDSGTYSRGSAYAAAGAVSGYQWTDGGRMLHGDVEGSAAEAYWTTVELQLTPAGRLAGIEGTCSCPVGWNCKHVVALLVTAAEAGSPSGRSPLPARAARTAVARPRRSGRRPDAEPPPPSWITTLEQLFPEEEPEEASPTLGLQFEVVAGDDRASPSRRQPPQRWQPPAARQSSSPSIRLRPVTLGASGRWTKSGVSWGSLDYLSYSLTLTSEALERLRLLKELRALHQACAGQMYYRYDEDLRLEAVTSRRVLDVLDEAVAAGIPLLVAGRPPRPVYLHRESATALLDVTESGDGGLELAPAVEAGSARVALGSAVLIGEPAYGIAFSEADEGTGGRPEVLERPGLHLARFASPVGAEVRRLLQGPRMHVPAGDRERFFAGVPLLRERISVVSRDGSVVLPAAQPVLVLTVAGAGEHRIGLAWSRGFEGSSARRPLRPGSGGFSATARAAAGLDADLVAKVTSLVRPVPGLVEVTAFGERLLPEAVLAGMAAVRFVAEVVPALAELDGVELEIAEELPSYREADEAPVVTLGRTSTDHGDWFDLTVEVTVGGEEVPFEQLFVALATGQSHLVLPSGTYFSLDSPELQRLAELIAEARGLVEAPPGTVRLNRFQASLWDDLRRLGVVAEQAAAWEESVAALFAASDRLDLTPPAGLQASLRPYQLQGFNWLAFLREHRLGGILADDMGLGKTLQAIALVCHTVEQGLSNDPYLVVAPTSVVGNWAAECRRFAPGLRVATVTETTRRRGVPLDELVAGADVVVTSYALFRLDFDHYQALAWAGMFLDEAQFVKNRNSKAHQLVRLLRAPFKVAITGTPMENNLMELWSLLSITAPGLFPNPQRFEEHYRLPIERNLDAERLAQLRRRLRPIVVRRTKEQVADDLPERQEQVLELDLNSRHQRLYQTYLARERQKVLGLIGDMTRNRFEILRSLTLLRQACLDVSLVDSSKGAVPSTKLDVLMEMLGDIVADGHRVLVFSQFTRFLGEARRRVAAAGIEHCYLDGRTRRREEVLAQFRSGEAQVFLISLKAGGFGLNLTEADYCILLDPWWNPATEAQAIDRIHRIGQTRKVMVYRLVANDTIEEKVMALKEKKAALFKNVVDSGEFDSVALGAEDIRALVS